MLIRIESNSGSYVRFSNASDRSKVLSFLNKITSDYELIGEGVWEKLLYNGDSVQYCLIELTDQGLLLLSKGELLESDYLEKEIVCYDPLKEKLKIKAFLKWK